VPGLLKIPELYLPLIKKFNMQFWHDTMAMIIPPKFQEMISYEPPKGRAYLIFAITFGRPRRYDPSTGTVGDVISTVDVGIWHASKWMKWHWDPLVESIYEIVYPQHVLVRHGEPYWMEIYNKTEDLFVYMDATIWLYEFEEKYFGEVEEYFDCLYERVAGCKRGG